MEWRTFCSVHLIGKDEKLGIKFNSA